MLNEGGFKEFWLGFLKIFVSGRPNKHPKVKILDNAYMRAKNVCHSLFPGTKISADAIHIDEDDTKSMGFEYYKANPKAAQCLIQSRISFLEAMVKLLKMEKGKICKYNKFADKCQKWVDTNLPDMEYNLKELKALVKVMKDIKPGKEVSLKSRWNIVMGG